MGVYATTTTILQNYPGIPQNDVSITTTLSQHIDNGEAIVNGYIGRRYPIPLTSFATSTTSVPILKTISEDISVYYYYRSSYLRDSMVIPETIQELYDRAMVNLDLLRERKIDLSDSTGAVISERSTKSRVASTTEKYTPTFDLDSSTSWSVDRDRLDDVAAARL